jgi:hypothetical protein
MVDVQMIAPIGCVRGGIVEQAYVAGLVFNRHLCYSPWSFFERNGKAIGAVMQKNLTPSSDASVWTFVDPPSTSPLDSADYVIVGCGDAASTLPVYFCLDDEVKKEIIGRVTKSYVGQKCRLCFLNTDGTIMKVETCLPERYLDMLKTAGTTFLSAAAATLSSGLLGAFAAGAPVLIAVLILIVLGTIFHALYRRFSFRECG